MSGLAMEIDTEDRDQMALALPKLLTVAGELSSKAGDQLIFAPFGLTTVKYIVLSMLMRHGGQPTMTELKDLLTRSPANMTQVIDSLEQAGLVERMASPQDRRVNLIGITSEGHNLMIKVESFFKARMHEYLREVTDAEMATFIRSLQRFIAKSAGLLGMKEICVPEVKP